MSGFWTGYYTGQAFGGESSGGGFEALRLKRENEELEGDYQDLRRRAYELVDACDHRYAVLYAREAQLKYLMSLFEGCVEMDSVHEKLNEINSESQEEMYGLFIQGRKVKRNGGGEKPVFPASPLDNTPLEREDFDL